MMHEALGIDDADALGVPEVSATDIPGDLIERIV